MELEACSMRYEMASGRNIVRNSEGCARKVYMK